MNWTNTLFKPASLAALLLMLGSNMASATDPVTTPRDGMAAVQAAQSSHVQSAAQPEIIRLAWDRVGAVA